MRIQEFKRHIIFCSTSSSRENKPTSSITKLPFCRLGAKNVSQFRPVDGEIALSKRIVPMGDAENAQRPEVETPGGIFGTNYLFRSPHHNTE